MLKVQIECQVFQSKMQTLIDERRTAARNMQEHESLANMNIMFDIVKADTGWRGKWRDRHATDLNNLRDIFEPYAEMWNRYKTINGGQAISSPRYKAYERVQAKLDGWNGQLAERSTGFHHSHNDGLREWLISLGLEDWAETISDRA